MARLYSLSLSELSLLLEALSRFILTYPVMTDKHTFKPDVIELMHFNI